jgi:hypothetical protein
MRKHQTARLLYRGRAKVHIQVYLSVTALNLKRLMKFFSACSVVTTNNNRYSLSAYSQKVGFFNMPGRYFGRGEQEAFDELLTACSYPTFALNENHSPTSGCLPIKRPSKPAKPMS